LTTLLEPLRLERHQLEAPTRRAWPWRDWLIVLLLLAGYAVLQHAFVRPPQPSDQLHYLVDAAALPQATWPAHQALRIGLTIPVWALTRLFGYSEAAYYGVPFLTTAALVVTTYWLARLLDSRAAGVISAVVIVANPYVLDDSSQLLPDLPAATLVMISLTLLLWLWRRSDTTQPPDRVAGAVLVVIGLLLGWAYLIREFIVCWYPVVALAVVMMGLPRRWWQRIVAGAAATFAFELAWGAVFFGTPFARIHAALNQPASAPWRVVQREELIADGLIPDTHLEMLIAMPRALVEFRTGWVLVVLAVALLLGVVLVREPGLRLMALWVAVPVVLLTAVIQVAWLFDTRILRAEKLRYWLPVFPPLVVGGVVAIIALGRWLGREHGRGAAVTVVAGVALLGLGMTAADFDAKQHATRNGQNQFLELREWAATSGQACDVLWLDRDQWRSTDRWIQLYLHTFWGRPLWQGEIRYVNTGDRFVDIEDLDRGALVRSEFAVRRRRTEGLPVAHWLRWPPNRWERLLVTNGNRIQVLGVGEDPCTP
jgi:hypothetical protein